MNSFSAEEKHNLGFGFTLDNERFRVLEWLRSSAHATRDSVAKTPYFPKTIFCPALIMGETAGSGHNSGSAGPRKLTTIPNESWKSLEIAPRSQNGVHSGLGNEDSLATAQLPAVVVDESLYRFPFGTTESNGWIPKID